MSRSVSVPRGAVKVVYASFQPSEPEFGYEEFQECISFLQSVLSNQYRSLSKCSEFIGREDHAVLENGFCYVTVSEYCGLVAVAVVPKESEYPGLAQRFCHKLKLNRGARVFGPLLRSKGFASNGEQFFEPVDGKQRGQLGLGFTSKQGWL